MKKRKAQAVIYCYAQDKTKHFLLLKMNERRQFLWQNVTGSVEKDESFQEGALREAIEETALQNSNINNITPLQLIFEFQDQWEKEVVEEVFAIEVEKKWEVILDPSEHCDFKWVSENEMNRESVHFSSNFLAIESARRI